MEPNKPRSLDWKTCFKKILAPHLLNPSEEQNDDPLPLKPTNSEGQNDACQNVVDPKNESINTIAFQINPEKYENERKSVNSPVSVESAHIDDISQSFIDGCQDSDSPVGQLNDAENPIEAYQNVADIIAADAEELAKGFTALKVKKRDKYFHNMAENSRNAPDWNIAFKKVLDPKSVPESPLKTPEEFVDNNLSHQEVLDSQDPNRWLYHRLCKKDEHLENMEEVKAQQDEMRKERHYTEEEKKVLEVLKKAGTFVRPPKPHMNVFDGAGVNCFKDSEIKQSTRNKLSKSKKPKNVPPPGGWVCIKPLTLEEIRSRPVNVIATECWDWDEDDW